MKYWERLSGRHRLALRVFFISAVATLLFQFTPVYRTSELGLYDLRFQSWNRIESRSLAPVRLYSVRDSTRMAGVSDAQLLVLIEQFRQAGASVFIFDTELFQDFAAVRKALPTDVGIVDLQSSEGQAKMLLDSEQNDVDPFLDVDGSLRGLPWEHPMVGLALDMVKSTGIEPPTPRGPRLMLKSYSQVTGKTGQDAGAGSSVEYLINYLETASPTQRAAILADFENTVVILERATTAADIFAEISTPIGTLTSGQVMMNLQQSLADRWTLVPLGPVGSSILFCLVVGGGCFFMSGRSSVRMAAIGALEAVMVLLLGVFSFSLGYDAPFFALLFGLLVALLLLALLEIQRGRQLLKSFGGAEDAQFSGEEVEASMLFTNLPKFLLEMEHNHDKNLLQYRRVYNEILANIASRFHGMVLDFQGDAQMLGFGLRHDDDDDREHAAEATAAALEIVEKVGELAAKWGTEPEQWKVHAGVCTGTIALGHVGAVQKQDIAAIGDTTNTAARLMGAAMKQKVPVLISKPTFLAAEGLIRAQERDPVELKGKTNLVEVFLAQSVDTEWQLENRKKSKDHVPVGGTLVYKGARKADLLITVAIGCLGLFCAYWVWSGGVLDKAEVRLFDLVHKQVGLVDADPRIVLVGIDNESVTDADLGPFPWSRGVYAQALRNLRHAEHQGLFLDVMFKTARNGDPEGDRALAQALQEDPRNVVAVVLTKENTGKLSDPSLFPAADFALLKKRNQLGLIHQAKLENEHLTRAAYLSLQETASHPTAEANLRRTYPSAAAALLLGPDEQLEVGDQLVRLGQQRIVADTRDTGKSAIFIRFGPPATAEGAEPQPSSYQILSFRRLLDPQDPIFQQLAGKYLLIGQLITEGQANEIDRVPTVVGALKGVEVHARILDSLLNDNYFRYASLGQRTASIFFVAGLTIFCMIRYREPRQYLMRLLGLGVLLGLYYLLSIWMFSLVTELLILWLTILFVAAAVALGRYTLTLKALDRVIPAEIAQEWLFHHQSQDRRLQATVLLTDIRGYTTLSEGRSAVAMLDVLNEYHKRTVACYEKHGGQALTYQGDAQIVVFGVFGKRKNPAADAVAAALGLQAICDDLRREWGIESRDDFDVGAGLCTGEVEVGMLGGGSNRQYSVVGETVRKAHKVQSLSADLAAPVILDEETFEATAGQVVADDLGMVQPQGLSHEIRLYRAREVK